MEVNRDEVTQEQWDELKLIARNYVCSECGGTLLIHTIPEKGVISVACHTLEHHGLVERETYTQSFRRGEDIHPAISANIERRMMPKDELGRAMNLLALRYPRAIVDPPTAALFILDCTRLDLDPLISPAEAVPVPFRSSRKVGEVWEEKVTVQMIITEDGWLSMAARGCPDRWGGAPSVERIDDKALAESLCGDPEAWVWKATGRTRDMEPGQTSSAYGYYTHNEHKKAVVRNVPAATQPGNQARVRAIKRWVRENFPECRQRMMDLTAEWVDRAEGIKAAKVFIDAEYSLISLPESEDKIGAAAGKNQGAEGKPGTTTLSSPKQEPTKIEVPVAEAEGEGFSIDLQWLKESLEELKWSEDTAKTWLVSKYKVSPEGTLEDVIKRLNREQAEEFVHEIQDRAAKKQLELFQ